MAKDSRKMSKGVSSWLSKIEHLPKIHARLMRVQIECNDWRKILDTYDTPNTFFYLDPPYVPDTRRDGGYKHEMIDEDHSELIERIQTLNGKVMLSGYESPVYDRLTNAKTLKGTRWHRLKWDTVAHSAGRTRVSGLQGDGNVTKKQKRTECVWLNYMPYGVTQLDLFDSES